MSAISAQEEWQRNCNIYGVDHITLGFVVPLGNTRLKFILLEEEMAIFRQQNGFTGGVANDERNDDTRRANHNLPFMVKVDVWGRIQPRGGADPRDSVFIGQDLCVHQDQLRRLLTAGNFEFMPL